MASILFIVLIAAAQAQWLAEPELYGTRFLELHFQALPSQRSGYLRGLAGTDLTDAFVYWGGVLWYSLPGRVRMDSAVFVVGGLFPCRVPNGIAYVGLQHRSFHLLDTARSGVPQADDALFVSMGDGRHILITAGWGTRQRWYGEFWGRVYWHFVSWQVRLWVTRYGVVARSQLGAQTASGIEVGVWVSYCGGRTRTGVMFMVGGRDADDQDP